MLKHSIVALGLMTLAMPASYAQNASEIAKAKSGKSCAECNLFQADLSFTQMRNISFAGARLRQSNMSLATMDGVKFDNANLSIANMYGGRFTGASFKKTNLARAILVGGHFGSANFEGANLTDANLSGAEMASAKGLTQQQLDHACGDSSTQLPSGLNVPHCG